MVGRFGWSFWLVGQLFWLVVLVGNFGWLVILVGFLFWLVVLVILVSWSFELVGYFGRLVVLVGGVVCSPWVETCLAPVGTQANRAVVYGLRPGYPYTFRVYGGNLYKQESEGALTQTTVTTMYIRLG